MYISIHAPREGSDQVMRWVISTGRQFLSTLPARGATRKMMRELGLD